ncbi:MAG TPA: thioredoxin [Chloroflexota bacterium]|nr:thioredoxin [Chloroflexota bacterium]
MSNNVIHTDDQGFGKAVLESKQPVLVDFWAPWCGPCRAIAPAIEELADQYEGRLRTVKVNVDDSPDTASRYGIQSIPSLVFFRNGEEIERVIGGLPKARLDAAIRQVLEPAGAQQK